MAQRSAEGLGVWDAAMLVVGSIVGSGIFLVSPSVARDVGSPGAFMAAWALGGGVALAGALSNGELGGMFPFSGGEYVYLREAYGPGVGFLSGWTSFWIAFPGSIAALAAGFSSTAAGMLGIGSPAVIKGLGLFCIAALTLVNALGLRSGKWLNNALSATKLAAFAVLLALGALVGHGALAAASARPAEGHTWSGIASALVPVLFAYSGWNAATYVAGEMRDPARGLGRALGLGTAICVVLYLAVNAAYLRAMTLGELAASSDSPARLTAERLGGAGFGAVLSPLVAVCVLSSLQATILVGPRIYQAMARDGLFFKPLARSHAATGSPVVALLAQAVISGVELVSSSFDQLLAFAMFSIVAFSTLAVGAVAVLRWRKPTLRRPFRVPEYPVVPALFIVVNAWVLWSELVGPYGAGALKGMAIVATGIPVYVAFRRRGVDAVSGPRKPASSTSDTATVPEELR
jgi:APA family basic amino acid/polyamine antiporter